MYPLDINIKRQKIVYTANKINLYAGGYYNGYIVMGSREMKNPIYRSSYGATFDITNFNTIQNQHIIIHIMRSKYNSQLQVGKLIGTPRTQNN